MITKIFYDVVQKLLRFGLVDRNLRISSSILLDGLFDSRWVTRDKDVLRDRFCELSFSESKLSRMQLIYYLRMYRINLFSRRICKKTNKQRTDAFSLQLQQAVGVFLIAISFIVLLPWLGMF